MPINGLSNLMGSPGGPRKPTWRWNLKFLFMESMSIYKRGYYCEKEAEKEAALLLTESGMIQGK